VVSVTPYYAQGKTPGAYWIGGWVGPRGGLDDVVAVQRIIKTGNPSRTGLHGFLPTEDISGVESSG
jgi:hypothetical protein